MAEVVSTALIGHSFVKMLKRDFQATFEPHGARDFTWSGTLFQILLSWKQVSTIFRFPHRRSSVFASEQFFFSHGRRLPARLSHVVFPLLTVRHFGIALHMLVSSYPVYPLFSFDLIWSSTVPIMTFIMRTGFL